MQNALLGIWSWVTRSTSYKDNHYAIALDDLKWGKKINQNFSLSLSLSLYIYIYIYIYTYIYMFILFCIYFCEGVSKHMQPNYMIIPVLSSHLSCEQSHFTKVKPDDKIRNWFTLSYCACGRLSSCERLRWDFLGLLPTESLTASTLLGHLSINFLPGLGFSAFFLRVFAVPVAWNLCTHQKIWLFWG